MFETGSHDYIGCAPIPGYYDEGSGDDDSYSDVSSSRNSQYADSSMATATHVDTSAVWATAGHRSRESAKKRVMDACAVAMGEGCVYSEALVGDVTIAVAVDGAGGTWLKGAAYSKTNAEQGALKICEENTGIWGCRIVFSFDNVLIPASADINSDYSKDYFPEGQARRRQWVLLASPEKTPAVAWHRKSWLVSGRQDYAAAKKEVQERCQVDSGESCTVRMGVANGVLAHYANSRRQGNWINAAGAAAPAARVDAACLAEEKPCRVLTLYDAVTPRLQVVVEPEPTRGYVSVAWPATASNWHRLAIVTGRPSVAVANADAIELCESQSKLRCDLYLDHPDNRNPMFLGVYSIPEDRVQIIFGHSVQDLKERAAESCLRNNLTCTDRVVVDLGKRGETTPSWKD